MSNTPSRPEEVPFELMPVSGMRRIIGERMVESIVTQPQFAVSASVDMNEIVALREQLKQTEPTKISFNDMVIKAVALALRDQPRINCSYTPEGIKLFKEVNVGFVASVTDGVVVPVVRNADQKSLVEIATETKSLVERARAGRLGARSTMGGTFSISNIGMFDVDLVIPIINTPQAAILGVGAIRTIPAVVGDKIAPRPICEFWLASDHRAVDGVISAQYLGALKAILEAPQRLVAAA
jgi:pyruvate dehydrogenase E2 component (dihydrolipoamide acetyltransferase)